LVLEEEVDQAEAFVLLDEVIGVTPADAGRGGCRTLPK